MADFKDLIDQQKITNEKQDKVIALLQEGDSPQALKRASADEVKAEYDTLKLGQVFEIAYSKISGMADIDNIIQDQAKQDAVAYQAMVESVSGQTDVLKKIAGILITGLGIDKKALLADQRERDEEGKFVSAKAIVSELGVNDQPEPTEPRVVETKNGRTMTYN